MACAQAASILNTVAVTTDMAMQLSDKGFDACAAFFVQMMPLALVYHIQNAMKIIAK